MNDADKHGAQVKRRILEMGIRLWCVDPAYVTSRRIAHELGLTHSAVLYHFVTMQALHNALAFKAVQDGESRVIMHLISMKHAAVATMSDAQRVEHMRAAAAH